jgi:hypothetical protein
MASGKRCPHKVRKATRREAEKDCCGDRYECNVAYACACGEKGCRSCMSDHLMEMHLR